MVNGSKRSFTILPDGGCNVPQPRACLVPLSKQPLSGQKDETVHAREKDSGDVRRILQELSVDLPSTVVDKMALSYNGMIPMERFLIETCQLQHKVPENDGLATLSDCGATIGSSKDSTSSHMKLVQSNIAAGEST
jgi:hypothetical protein